MKFLEPLDYVSKRPRRESTDLIVVHCSASQQVADIGAFEIHKMHLLRGWQGIGYHLVIRKDGSVEIGEPMDNVGAHTKGHNLTSIGICLTGGINARGDAENNFTPEQFGMLALVLDWLTEWHPDAKVTGHRDLSPDIDGDGIIESWEWTKQCPCFDAGAFWQAIKE